MKKSLIVLSFSILSALSFSNETKMLDKPESVSLEINENYGKTLNDMGSYYFTQGNYPLAENYYKESLKSESDPTAYFNLGLLYRKMKMREESAENFKKAYELTKKVEILEHLGHIYAVMGESDESKYQISREYFKKAHMLNFIEGTYNYAAMNEKLGDLKTAKKIFKTLVENDKNGDVYFHLGKIDFKEKNYVSALDNYIKAAKLGNKYSYNEIAVLYDFDNNYKEAEKYYKKSIETAKSKKALQNFEKMLQEQGKLEEYKEYAKQFKEDYFDPKY